MTPILIEAIKEQQGQIEELKKLNDDTLNLIKQLQVQLAGLKTGLNKGKKEKK